MTLTHYCAAGRRFVVEDPHHPLLQPQDKIKIQKSKEAKIQLENIF